ncbi:hypothetical protein [Rhodopseudomonas sp. B29]|uniref:hypothetical protein n=1 Tax=Rhodopseudomonas sp. B29 TaxID=95607 RepID=UPI00034962AA|nr:hypothetical protein [Rhodopseudomonas sp. B29]
MPYALFCDDAKISKSYPTEASVWKHASESGLVVDVDPGDETPKLRRVLDNGYEIRQCPADPGESPEHNEAEAHAARDYQLAKAS